MRGRYPRTITKSLDVHYLPVWKRDGGIRLCVDFEHINNITVLDPYLMLKIDYIIKTISNAKLLSTRDLNEGVHQIPEKQADVTKTTICTHCGKFQYKTMPTRLRNVPATTQRLMDQILDDLLKFSRAYIDTYLMRWGKIISTTSRSYSNI